MHGRRILLPTVIGSICSAISHLAAAESAGLPIVKGVELQPLAAQVRRLIEATDYLGSPLDAADKQAVEKAFSESNADVASEAIQRALDKYCLFAVSINPESRVKVAAGPAKHELIEKGWRQFLVKIQNEAGVTAELRAVSPNALSLYESGSSSTASDKALRKRGGGAVDARELWLDL